MLKKTITYTDFNGEEVQEDFFFHLSKAELVELEMSHEGGLSSSLQRIVAAEDGKGIIKEFKGIILGAYGKKTPDGRRFVKTPEIRSEFESSEAYSVLFMELITDTDAAINFINGVVPTGMAEEAAKLAEGNLLQQEKESEVVRILPKPEPVILTRMELEEMSQEQLVIIAPKLASGEIVLGE